MVEEIVNSILQAEDKAEIIRKDALAQSKNKIATAQLNSSAVREKTEKQMRVELEEGHKKSEEKAQQAYDIAIAEGKREAGVMILKSEQNTKTAVSEIVTSILG